MWWGGDNILSLNRIRLVGYISRCSNTESSDIMNFIFNSIFFLLICFSETCEDVKKYLHQFGYLQTEDNFSLQLINETTVSNALIIFQEYYKLPVDGTLNNETRQFMLKSRCGNADTLSNFRTSTFKWNKSLLKWHYYLATQEVLELASKAFALWEQNSSLSFEHNRTDPDILISNKRLKHKMQSESIQCASIFDGVGGVVGHGYYPDSANSRREIHIDEDEPWSYSIETNKSSDKLSLFATLVHEIGHTLGISHSDVPDSVMFAYYNGKIELGDDDIVAVQNLYGKPKSISTPTSPTPTQLSTIEDNKPIENNQIDLCYLNNINTLLVAKNRLYILHDKWLWMININDMSYSNPAIITDWLTFLPKNFKKVVAVYQRPSGEIVMIVDSLLYMFDLISLQLAYGYPKQVLSVFNVQSNKIHTVFNSYTGKTYIFHNDNYFREFDECSFSIKSWGYISDVFPGIPPQVDSSFRFTDGNLYFFKNNSVFAFNEFTSQLLKAERNNLSIFGLRCTDRNLITKLKEILSQLINQETKVLSK